MKKKKKKIKWNVIDVLVNLEKRKRKKNCSASLTTMRAPSPPLSLRLSSTESQVERKIVHLLINMMYDDRIRRINNKNQLFLR